MLVDSLQRKEEIISSLQEENRELNTKMRKQRQLMATMEKKILRDKLRLESVTELEQKIEKFEFILNIEKYRKSE